MSDEVAKSHPFLKFCEIPGSDFDNTIKVCDVLFCASISAGVRVGLKYLKCKFYTWNVLA